MVESNDADNETSLHTSPPMPVYKIKALIAKNEYDTEFFRWKNGDFVLEYAVIAPPVNGGHVSLTEISHLCKYGLKINFLVAQKSKQQLQSYILM
jgi:hypothetical protein